MAAGSFAARLRTKFGRRSSTALSATSSTERVGEPEPSIALSIAQSIRSLRSRGNTRTGSVPGSPRSTIEVVQEEDEWKRDVVMADSQLVNNGLSSAAELSLQNANVSANDLLPKQQKRSGEAVEIAASASSRKHLQVVENHNQYSSSSTSNIPTPGSAIGSLALDEAAARLEPDTTDTTGTSTITSHPQPPSLERKQSLLPAKQTQLIKTLLETNLHPPSRTEVRDYFATNGPSTISATMVHRKIWVKRPQASATLVQIHEDDLVDDVRDMILKKYANSLGRNFDSPDVTLRIVPREQRQERILGPEEPISRTIDAYYPGGQTVDEALVIDVPLRRTPKPSPRGAPIYFNDELRPMEAGTDYFPPMPIPPQPSPRLTAALPINGPHHPGLTAHAMSVLTTGHVPNLPSPGSVGRRTYRRPGTVRQHTSSPTVIGQPSEKTTAIPAPPPLPTPPVQELQRVSTPPPRVTSPRPGKAKKSKKNNEHPNLPAGMLNGAVPPINVLIVEDNIINLKLLEAFMKRLRVRWQTAMNGKEAVTKWRAGGFHLVLMDIQLPIMNGLDATREIRRLEKLNNIGVFSSSASSSAPEQREEPEGEDKLPSTVLFKSPVIIVALTASSLQSDRHEALAAGCNDFLTKPVNFVWLERKVMEWGCMQALIDFDGWRKWKDFSQQNDENDKSKSAVVKKKKNRNSLGGPSGVGRIPEEGAGS